MQISQTININQNSTPSPKKERTEVYLPDSNQEINDRIKSLEDSINYITISKHFK